MDWVDYFVVWALATGSAWAFANAAARKKGPDE